MPACALHLVVPGLLGPWPQRDPIATPRASALERFLSRARTQRLPAAGADETLLHLFRLPTSAPGDLPVAPLTRLADTGRAESGWWLRADPVHLRADANRILLFDARCLETSENEAASLVTALNQTFGADGLRFEAPHPERWYLRLEGDPGVVMCPLSEAIGQSIDNLLPRGDGYQRWHTLLTEIQLLLYGADVNVARESCGRASINSVWFWGGGQLPESVYRAADSAYGSDPLMIGLATVAGMATKPLPDDVAAWRGAAGEAGDSLVVLESTRFDRVDGAAERWKEHLKALDRTWFGPCLEMLTRRTLDQLTIYPCNGRAYVASAGDLRRFWRRVRKLSYHL